MHHKIPANVNKNKNHYQGFETMVVILICFRNQTCKFTSSKNCRRLIHLTSNASATSGILGFLAG